MSLQGKNETILACTICGVTPSQGSVGDVCVKCMLAAGFRPEQHASTRAVQSPRGFAPPSPNELKEDFPQLEIIELAGVGGMGAVYRAKEKGLDRIVALKILPRESATKPDFAVRFAQEAKALAKLNHKNIVQVYQADKNDRYFFFLMEFVDGINLRQAIQQGKLPPAEAMAIVPQICDALDFAHRNGVVHRDIKPENILVDKNGVVKVADFGLAKMIDGDLNLTATQQIMGTLHYMAPEQLRETSTVDHRADIYSLGVVFYEILTGHLPLGNFAMPSDSAQVDPRLDSVVMRTLENQPDKRYQAASDVRSEIASVRSDSQADGTPQGDQIPADKPALLAGAKGMLFIPGVILFLIAIWELLTRIFFHNKFGVPSLSEGDSLLDLARFECSLFSMPVFLMFIAWAITQARFIGLLRFVSATLVLSAIMDLGFWTLIRHFFVKPNQILDTGGNGMGLVEIIPMMGGTSFMAFNFGIAGLLALFMLFSKPVRSLQQSRRKSEQHFLGSTVASLTSAEEASSKNWLRLASVTMLTAGVCTLLIPGYFLICLQLYGSEYLRDLAPNLPRYFSFGQLLGLGSGLLDLLTVCIGPIMIASGVFLRRLRFYRFNILAGCLALLAALPAISPLSSLAGIVTLSALWPLNSRLVFFKNYQAARAAEA